MQERRLRLAWVNPGPSPASEGARADLSLVPAPSLPGHPIKLDLAIERHLDGSDGLSAHEFLHVFSGARARSAR